MSTSRSAWKSTRSKFSKSSCRARRHLPLLSPIRCEDSIIQTNFISRRIIRRTVLNKRQARRVALSKTYSTVYHGSTLLWWFRGKYQRIKNMQQKCSCSNSRWLKVVLRHSKDTNLLFKNAHKQCRCSKRIVALIHTRTKIQALWCSLREASTPLLLSCIKEPLWRIEPQRSIILRKVPVHQASESWVSHARYSTSRRPSRNQLIRRRLTMVRSCDLRC